MLLFLFVLYTYTKGIIYVVRTTLLDVWCEEKARPVPYKLKLKPALNNAFMGAERKREGEKESNLMSSFRYSSDKEKTNGNAIPCVSQSVSKEANRI